MRQRVGSRDRTSLGDGGHMGLRQSLKVFVCVADLLRSNNFSFGSFLCALAQKEKNSDSDSSRITLLAFRRQMKHSRSTVPTDVTVSIRVVSYNI